MKIHLGCDHAGFEVKEKLVSYLKEKNHEVIDHGAHVYDAQDDYPLFCFLAAQNTAKDKTSLGIVLGGSGNGEQIAANKIKGVRAALAWSAETAKLAREHNNANVIGIGARMHSFEEITKIVDAFINTSFSNDERHIRRINQLSQMENNGTLPSS
ncbi:MAG: ribose-5-phosphate isomerase [Actinomycetes bacterium]